MLWELQMMMRTIKMPVQDSEEKKKANTTLCEHAVLSSHFEHYFAIKFSRVSTSQSVKDLKIELKQN